MIINDLNKAKDEYSVNLKLADTGKRSITNRILYYGEQFMNIAKDGPCDLIFVMG